MNCNLYRRSRDAEQGITGNPASVHGAFSDPEAGGAKTEEDDKQGHGRVFRQNDGQDYPIGPSAARKSFCFVLFSGDQTTNCAARGMNTYHIQTGHPARSSSGDGALHPVRLPVGPPASLPGASPGIALRAVSPRSYTTAGWKPALPQHCGLEARAPDSE
jgi:hypothetical protein